MGENWIGKAVSIKCVDDFGIFQGIIKDADNSRIVISKAFRNGLPIKTLDTEVTIMATDILKINLIPSQNSANINNGIHTNGTDRHRDTTKTTSSPPNHHQNHYQQQYNRQQKMPSSKSPNMNAQKPFGDFIPAKVEVKMTINSTKRSNVQMLQRNPSQTTPAETRSTTNNDTANATTMNNGVANGNEHSNSNTNGTSMQAILFDLTKKKKNHCNNFDKNTFGTPIDDPVLDEDFDFEKNLALFDKQAIWNKIDAQNVDKSIKKNGKKNYRHDENILNAEPVTHRQIMTPAHVKQEYVTDDGIIVPTVSLALRNRILLQAEIFGLTWERQCDMLSRSAVELALNMLGGARRLSMKNQHQWPKIVVICDEICSERHSEIGFSTGRQLATQGLKLHILVKQNLDYALQSNKEAELYKATGNFITTTVDDLPSCDLIILSVPKPITDLKVIKWITESRALLMAIDPPTTGITNLNIKCSILPILPLENINGTCGKLYLSNLSIPEKFYRDAGIEYKSPFGHKFVIPLHSSTTKNQSQ